MSTNLMRFLMIVYALIVLFSLYEHNWRRAEYWIGALLITHAVLGLK